MAVCYVGPGSTVGPVVDCEPQYNVIMRDDFVESRLLVQAYIALKTVGSMAEAVRILAESRKNMLKEQSIKQQT